MMVFKEQLLLKEHLELNKEATIGLVPTMGALHSGHLALVKQAVKENDHVIVSIFVNPTQFGDQNDLNAYPKTFAEDIKKLSAFGEKVYVYAPEVRDVYPDETTAEHFNFGSLETIMEGESRQGHFQGVATIVFKLLVGFMPNRAYFGEKDYQQLSIIHDLVAQKKIPVQIVNCTIVREEDGLAMSSRNTRLSKEQREIAPLIYQTLLKAKALKEKKELTQIKQWVEAFFNSHPGFKLDYFCIANAQSLQPVTTCSEGEKIRAFIAVKLGDIRLIDNINF